MRQDIERHQNFCLRCQQRKKLTNKQTPLAPLPIPECPNLQIHADLFGPMLTADSNKKFVLCIMDAFTKYSGHCDCQQGSCNGGVCHFQGLVRKIWNPGADTYRRRQGIREQTFGGAVSITQRTPHKNITGPPAVQCSSGSV